MDGHDIRPSQHRVEFDQLDAMVGGGFRADERVHAEDRHLHRPGAHGDGLPDLAQADDTERPAAQLEAGELGALPFAAPDRGVGRGRPAGDPVEQREGVLGGGDRVAGRGVDDHDPGPRRGLQVDVVDTDAGPPDDDQPRGGGDELGVDLDLAADDQRVVVGQDRAQLIAAEARPLVDLVTGSQELDALLGDGLGHEDPHAPAPADAGTISPNDSIAATCAAATAEPGRTGRPKAIDTNSRTLIAPRISSTVTDPRWPSRKILPVSLPWPPASTSPRRFSSVLKAFQSRSSGTSAPVTVRDAKRGIGQQLEAERGQPGPGRGRTRLVPGEDVLGALGVHQPDPLVDLVDDGDGRGPRGLALGMALAMHPQVEVDAWRGRGLHRGPGTLRGGDHRQTGRRHPGLLRAGDDDVDAPGVHLERDGAKTGHAVDEDERLGRGLADDGGQRRDRVHDRGRRLVVGQQHGLVRLVARELGPDDLGIGRLAPLDLDLGDVRAVGPGDLGEPVAERPDRHAEHPIARAR